MGVVVGVALLVTIVVAVVFAINRMNRRIEAKPTSSSAVTVNPVSL